MSFGVRIYLFDNDSEVEIPDSMVMRNRTIFVFFLCLFKGVERFDSMFVIMGNPSFEFSMGKLTSLPCFWDGFACRILD